MASKVSFIRRFAIFKSIKSKLIVAFSVFTLLIFLVVLAFFWYTHQDDRGDLTIARLNQLNFQVEDAINLEKDFFIHESINPTFHKDNESLYLEKHRELFEKIYQNLAELREAPSVKNNAVAHDIIQLFDKIKAFEYGFDNLVNQIRIRGFKDYGLEGKMRDFIHQVEDAPVSLSLSKILTIRRHEKDFILRKEEKYIRQLHEAVQALTEEAQRLIQDQEERRKILRLLDLYEETFLALVEAEKAIGMYQGNGLKQELTALSQRIEQLIVEINRQVHAQANQTKARTQTILIILFFLFFTFITSLGYFLVRKLSRPIRQLSRSIHQVIDQDFAPGTEVHQSSAEDEIGGISRDVSLMLDKVRERTREVITQKEETDRAYQNIKELSEIGQEITANLSLNNIIEVSRKHMQRLTNAPVFGIGLYNRSKKRLDFLSGQSYLPEDLPKHLYLEDNQNLAIRAFEKQENIQINDWSQEAPQYWQAPIPATNYQSQVYIPLIFHEKSVGVMTVQSPQKYAFSEHHQKMLQNTAVYITIALENARIYQSLNLRNQKMVDSINYAQRIQEAMLPKLETIQAVFPDSFILFKPRDIVSGDFYWFAQTEVPSRSEYRPATAAHSSDSLLTSPLCKKTILAAVDCTGHGVPGAFMSMIGNDLLNEIVIQNQETEADQILNKLHDGIRTSLRQNETENQDGMDVALCVINPEEKVLEYAGAFHRLVFIHDQKIEIIRSDKQPVGVWYEEYERRQYTKHIIPIPPEGPSVFYLYTDGYVDQLGGPNRKKFLSTNLHKLLLEIHEKPMREQKIILNQRLEAWKGQGKQNDDVMVIGFRIDPHSL